MADQGLPTDAEMLNPGYEFIVHIPKLQKRKPTETR